MEGLVSFEYYGITKYVIVPFPLALHCASAESSCPLTMCCSCNICEAGYLFPISHSKKVLLFSKQMYGSFVLFKNYEVTKYVIVHYHFIGQKAAMP